MWYECINNSNEKIKKKIEKDKKEKKEKSKFYIYI